MTRSIWSVNLHLKKTSKTIVGSDNDPDDDDFIVTVQEVISDSYCLLQFPYVYLSVGVFYSFHAFIFIYCTALCHL